MRSFGGLPFAEMIGDGRGAKTYGSDRLCVIVDSTGTRAVKLLIVHEQ